ncbi:hypothetical protein BDZ89DRAFT_1066409 [Hymenopellis radicata]|nr:hypothetical protein BDZ89DRAFT_1066409 [Hymenopellis radicata]
MSSVAEEHAAKVASYIQAHASSSEFVQSDVSRRDRLLREFEQSDKAMRMETSPPSTLADIDGMLQKYDAVLAQPPQTFEDHIHRMIYAFSALILFQAHVINPLSEQDRKFNQDFMSGVNRRVNGSSHDAATSTAPPSQSKPQSSDSTVREGIATKADAKKLLRDNVRLMQLRFIMSPDTPEEGRWRVGGINLKPDGKTQYMVQFADIPDDELPMLEDELVGLLCDSAIEASTPGVTDATVHSLSHYLSTQKL